jgi:hypothetical protein
MRGAVLAFPDLDRSHTCSVRDRPTQLCLDRKAGRHSPQPREWLRPVCPPLFPTCYGAPGWVGAGRVRIAAKQEPRPDLIYLLGNASGLHGRQRSLKKHQTFPMRPMEQFLDSKH